VIEAVVMLQQGGHAKIRVNHLGANLQAIYGLSHATILYSFILSQELRRFIAREFFSVHRRVFLWEDVKSVST